MVTKYFMDDRREAARLESKVHASAFVEKYLSPYLQEGAANILEAGCGPGMFLEVLAKKYPSSQITGIDISSDRIAHANERLKNCSNARGEVASIYELPDPDNHFDFIYSRFLFEYLDNPLSAAKELYRVCKPGGMIFLQDLDNQFTFYPALSERLNDCLQTLHVANGFDPEIGRKLYSICRSAGFSFVNADVEGYHKIFGKADAETQRQWDIKLDIAFANMKSLFGKADEDLKAEMLNALRSDESVMYSTIVTVCMIKV